VSSKARINPWVLVGGFLLVAPLLVLLASGFGKDPRSVPTMMEDKPAPTFELTDLDGKSWDLESLRGQVVVLNFWSTWCLPCKQEHPVLLKAQAVYPEVRFLGVVFQDEAAKVTPYLKQKGSAYPHLLDPGSTVAIDYGVAGVPETFFVDQQGRIARKHVGPLTQAALASNLDPLLGAH
jgi:cytochrome c biogenesis protein CcmG/thiol:disulfide interchange protein DsbE